MIPIRQRIGDGRRRHGIQLLTQPHEIPKLLGSSIITVISDTALRRFLRLANRLKTLFDQTQPFVDHCVRRAELSGSHKGENQPLSFFR